MCVRGCDTYVLHSWKQIVESEAGSKLQVRLSKVCSIVFQIQCPKTSNSSSLVCASSGLIYSDTDRGIVLHLIQCKRRTPKPIYSKMDDCKKQPSFCNDGNGDAIVIAPPAVLEGFVST